MRSAAVTGLVASLILGASLGCAFQQKKVEKEIATGAPVDCRTAEGDIRVLESEKAHVAQRIAEGVTSIVPASLVIGILTGVEGTKIRVAIGEYNKKIDEHIALIKSTCGVS
jgi:hypothetical protein